LFLMTALNEALKGKVCVYCANNTGGCAADVPWYCVSINCKHFTEEPPQQEVKRRKVNPLRYLVDTF